MCDRDAPVPEARAEFCFNSTSSPPSIWFIYVWIWPPALENLKYLSRLPHPNHKLHLRKENKLGNRWSSSSSAGFNPVTQLIDQVLVNRAAPGSLSHVQDRPSCCPSSCGGISSSSGTFLYFRTHVTWRITSICSHVHINSVPLLFMFLQHHVGELAGSVRATRTSAKRPRSQQIQTNCDRRNNTAHVWAWSIYPGSFLGWPGVMLNDSDLLRWA